jgi:hypothetical protein
VRTLRGIAQMFKPTGRKRGDAARSAQGRGAAGC